MSQTKKKKKVSKRDVFKKIVVWIMLIAMIASVFLMGISTLFG